MPTTPPTLNTTEDQAMNDLKGLINDEQLSRHPSSHQTKERREIHTGEDDL